MEIAVVSTSHAPQAIGPYSQACVVGDLIYTSGQIPLLPNGDLLAGDIKAQTTQVLKNLEAVLKAAGSDLDQVIKTTIFLVDMRDFASVNEVYAQFFCGHKPARSTVAVKELPRNVGIEIECIALKKF